MSDKMSVAEYRQLSDKSGKLKPSKYKAIKTSVDDIKFDSKKEAKRYGELMIRMKVGEISKPIVHYVFQLIPELSYEADFVYFDYNLKAFIVEDTKGVRTQAYKMKKKLMRELLSIEIIET
jgi:hypothetical protein